MGESVGEFSLGPDMTEEWSEDRRNGRCVISPNWKGGQVHIGARTLKTLSKSSSLEDKFPNKS